MNRHEWVLNLNPTGENITREQVVKGFVDEIKKAEPEYEPPEEILDELWRLKGEVQSDSFFMFAFIKDLENQALLRQMNQIAKEIEQLSPPGMSEETRRNQPQNSPEDFRF